MIAIPNMDKPKDCTECPFKRDGECLARVEADDFDSYRKLYQHCPQNDIVRCGECKWYNPWHANHTNIDGNYCRNIDRPMKPTDFCSYGERRSDVSKSNV